MGRKSQVIEKNGRSERIRTSDPLVPNEVRYQAALHSDIWRGAPTAGEGPYSDAGRGGQGPKALRGRDSGAHTVSHATLFFLRKDEVAGKRPRHYGPRAGQDRIF